MSKRIAKIIAAALLMLGTNIAAAYTECTVTPTAVLAGDEGSFYISYSNGGSGAIASADPDFKQTVMLVTAAILSEKDIDVRYAGNGVSCTSAGQLLVGVRLWRQ